MGMGWYEVFLLWMWMSLRGTYGAQDVLSPSVTVAQGNATSCQALTDMMQDGTLVLDGGVLKVANGSVQEILDCLPSASTLLLDIDEIPLGEGFIIQQPITIEPKTGTSRLLCPTDGIKINASDVTLRGLRIGECTRAALTALVNIESAQNILLDNIEFFDNTNGGGPSCILGTNSTVTLHNMNVLGSSGYRGGVMRMANSTIVIENSKFQKNSGSSSSDGGAVYLTDCNLDLRNTLFEGNNAVRGGALYFLAHKHESLQINVDGCDFIGNKGYSGGAVYSLVFGANNPSILFNGCTFSNNIASYGGGVYSSVKGGDSPFLHLVGCALQNNSAYSGGGMMSKLDGASNSRVLIEACNATKNSAKAEGGGLHSSVFGATNPSIQFNGCIVEDNTAHLGGGVMSVVHGGDNSRIVFNACSATRNSANTNGGGILSWVRVARSAHVRFEDCVAVKNSAGTGGGGFLSWVIGSNSTHLQFTGCNLEENSCSRSGGGIYSLVRGSNDSSITTSGCTFQNNRAPGDGGGIMSTVLGSKNSRVQFSACTLKDNKSARGGGIMSVVDLADKSFIRFDACNARNNIADSEGGGLKSLVLRSSNSHVQFNACTFEDNKSARGGGIMSMVTTSNNSLVDFRKFSGSRNTAEIDGGGILSWLYETNNSRVHFEGCSATQNSADSSGGGFLSWVDRGNNGHVRFDECTVEDNMANLGAGVMSWGSGANIGSISFAGCNVANNSAHRSGGGLYFGVVRSNDTRSKLERCLAEDEIAFENRRFASIINTIFTGNKAGSHGGGVYAQNVESGTIASCAFESNSAKKGGGLYVYGAISEHEERKVWDIANSSFTNNFAKEVGGGVSGFNGFDLKVVGSTFYSNSAIKEGGAVAAKSSSGFPNVTLLLHQSMLINNTAHSGGEGGKQSLQGVPNSGGGALSFAGEESSLTCKYSLFSGNMAGSGGAILGSDSAQLTISDSDMSKNLATLGGAVAFRDVVNSTLLNNTLKNNFGHQGGAVYAIGSGFFYTYEIERTKKAIQRTDHQFVLKILDSNFTRNDALLGGGALHVSGITLLCSDSKFDSNLVNRDSQELGGQGGGLRLQSGAAVHLRNSEIKSCEAQLGGGISMEGAILIGHDLKFNENYASDVGGAIAAVYGSDFRSNDPVLGECHGCSFTSNHVERAGIVYVMMEEYEREYMHRQLLLNRTKISANSVRGSGPLILVTNLNDIQICCEFSSKCLTGEDLHGMDESCIDETFEDTQILGTFMEKVLISPDTISNHASGYVLPDIRVTLLDTFGNTSPIKATLTVSSFNDSSHLDLAVPPIFNEVFNGTTNLTGIKMTARPGKYKLLLKVKTAEGTVQVVNEMIQVEVRECRVGEISMQNERGCFECPTNFYSFNPHGKWCKSCSDLKAHCNGTTLAPVNGYWHSSSYSDLLLPCLNDNACSYDGRLDKLIESAQEHIDSGITWDSGYPLCNEGYESVLCGSCSRNVSGAHYGKNPSLDCERCIEHFWKALYVLLSIAVLVGLTVLFVKRAKVYAQETLSRGVLLRSQAFAPSTDRTSLPTERHSRSNVQVVVSHSSLEGNELDPADILKILVNFLQVSTTVTSFKVDWQGAVLKVLDTFDWLSGIATGSAYFAFSCAFQSPDRFIYANYLAIALPFIVWMGFALVALIMLATKKSPFEDVKTLMFVSAMAILDISYIGLTQKMVQVFYCVPVDLGNGTRWYWAEDTSIQCYRESHIYLVMFAGAPLLIFVCLGFPIGLFVKLYRKKRPLHSGLMLSRYGYFYQGYFANFAYWEVLVQVRKGLLAVISVLSSAISEELKVYFALAVLMVAVALHTWCYPYKQQKLNRMEISSLFISSFVCLLEGVTHSPEGREKWATLLSVVIMVFLIGFVAYMMFEYLRLHIRSMLTWLEEQNEYREHTGGIFSWLKVSGNVLISQSKSQINTVGENFLVLASGSANHRRSMFDAYSTIEEEERDSSEEQDSAAHLLD